MCATALELGEYDLPARNKLAAIVIERYAVGHAIADIALGLGGFFPVPGAATASIIASMLLQVPIYKSMAIELAGVYESPYDDIAKGIVKTGVVVGSAIELGAELASQFGMEFAKETATEIVKEMGASFAASIIPFFGGFVSTGLDVVIAVTMTWRVGTMVAIYYQNGGQWVENRRQTYKHAKELTGGLSSVAKDRVDLNDVPRKVPEVGKQQARQLVRFVQELLSVAPNLDDATIRQILTKKGILVEIADDVIRRVRSGDGASPPDAN